jgi:hypothetical protein
LSFVVVFYVTKLKMEEETRGYQYNVKKRWLGEFLQGKPSEVEEDLKQIRNATASQIPQNPPPTNSITIQKNTSKKELELNAVISGQMTIQDKQTLKWLGFCFFLSKDGILCSEDKTITMSCVGLIRLTK